MRTEKEVEKIRFNMFLVGFIVGAVAVLIVEFVFIIFISRA